MYRLDQLRIFTEPQQGATYDDLLAVARRAEVLGFGAFFRSDHYLPMGEARQAGGWPGPTDAWTTLAGLARDTSTIRLGTLVSPVTFRAPGVLAVQVAGVDQMSGGRVELGLGTGWYDDEHTAYGLPFPPLAERFDHLEEQLTLITGLWSTPVGERYHYDGEHYRVVDSPALPKPVQSTADGTAGVPIIVGGQGPRRTPAIAARFAHEYNATFLPLDDFVAQRNRVIACCESIGRDPASIVFSAALVVAVGATPAEAQRRRAAAHIDPAGNDPLGIIGTIEQAAETLERWRMAGAERIYLQVLDLADLDHLDVISAAVAAG